MDAPDGSKPLDLLNDFLLTGDHHLIAELGDADAAAFKRLRAPYFIDGDAPPFTIRPVTEQEMLTLSGERYTFVEDWLHVPTNRLMHIAYQRRDFGGELEWDEPVVFFGTHERFVFALEHRGEGQGPSVIPAPKEQWDSVTDRTGHWWGRALYNDEYTDFFMYGLYRLPMHYRLLSRNDYESRKGQTGPEIVAELTALGYEHVGDIVWTPDGMTDSFEPVRPGATGTPSSDPDGQEAPQTPKGMSDMTAQDAPTFTEGNMITGMCLWEAFLSLTATPADQDDAEDEEAPETEEGSDADVTAKANDLFDDHGSFTIRAALISLVKPCEDAWAAHSAGKDDGEQFDWDWCPRFLRGAMADGSLADAIEGQYRP